MACLGGDGVILHASNLFKGAVPPIVSFNLGSLGFLTSHTVSSLILSFVVDLCFLTDFHFSNPSYTFEFSLKTICRT